MNVKFCSDARNLGGAPFYCRLRIGGDRPGSHEQARIANHKYSQQSGFTQSSQNAARYGCNANPPHELFWARNGPFYKRIIFNKRRPEVAC